MVPNRPVDDPSSGRPAALAELLRRTIDESVPALRAIPDGPGTAAPNRPSGTGWSQREELGHLIDSAVNNHLRFVTAALGTADAAPDYDQEGWVAAHRYRETPWKELVDLWHAHNRALLPLVAAIPDARLDATLTIAGDPAVTLAFLIDDYVLHMRHHLDQILRRTPVTRYPPA